MSYNFVRFFSAFYGKRFCYIGKTSPPGVVEVTVNDETSKERSAKPC